MIKLAVANRLFWLALLIVGFGIIGFVDLVVQQNYRLGADDPQIQMAEDSAAALKQGKSPDSLIPPYSVDITQSLAPFETIVNSKLQIIATNATAPNPSILLPPLGVFTDAAKEGELNFTWQTADGQRFATIVTPAGSDFVLAARSLKEVEKREDLLLDITIVAWICVLLTVAVLYKLSRIIQSAK
jgi:hypothetical protein